MNFTHQREITKLDIRHLPHILRTRMRLQNKDGVLFLRWVDAFWLRAGYQNTNDSVDRSNSNKCFNRRFNKPLQLRTGEKANLSKMQKF